MNFFLSVFTTPLPLGSDKFIQTGARNIESFALLYSTLHRACLSDYCPPVQQPPLFRAGGELQGVYALGCPHETLEVVVSWLHIWLTARTGSCELVRQWMYNSELMPATLNVLRAACSGPPDAVANGMVAQDGIVSESEGRACGHHVGMRTKVAHILRLYVFDMHMPLPPAGAAPSSSGGSGDSCDATVGTSVSAGASTSAGDGSEDGGVLAASMNSVFTPGPLKSTSILSSPITSTPRSTFAFDESLGTATSTDSPGDVLHSAFLSRSTTAAAAAAAATDNSNSSSSRTSNLNDHSNNYDNKEDDDDDDDDDSDAIVRSATGQQQAPIPASTPSSLLDVCSDDGTAKSARSSTRSTTIASPNIPISERKRSPGVSTSLRVSCPSAPPPSMAIPPAKRAGSLDMDMLVAEAMSAKKEKERQGSDSLPVSVTSSSGFFCVYLCCVLCVRVCCCWLLIYLPLFFPPTKLLCNFHASTI